MDKKEILEKSQKENQLSDERDRQIEQQACTAGYRAVIGVNCCLILLLYLQEWLTGSAYTDWWQFALAIFVAVTAHDLTLYRYYHKRLYLFKGLIGLALLIFTVFILVNKGPL